MSSLGQKIRELRKQRKLTQQELAAGLVTASMVSQIESDRATPSPKLLEQLAERLGVDTAYFREDMTHKSDQVQTYRRAKLLIDMQQYADAIPLLESLLYPRSPQFREEVLYQELAECHIQLGQYDQAEEMYERVVRSAVEKGNVPDAVRAYFELGRARRNRGQLGVARMFWQRAKELLARHPEVNMPLALKIEMSLARVHLSFKAYDQARACYEAAALLTQQYGSPLDHALVQHGLATLLVETGDCRGSRDATLEAIRLYEKVGHQRGINQCRINLAVIMRYEGKHEQAVTYLTECMRTREFHDDPIRLCNALAERGLNWYHLNNLDAAIEDGLRALRSDKRTPEVQGAAHELLARAYRARKDAPSALRHGQLAIQSAIALNDQARVVQLHRLIRQIHLDSGNASGAVASAVTLAKSVRRWRGIAAPEDAVGAGQPLSIGTTV